MAVAIRVATTVSGIGRTSHALRSAVCDHHYLCAKRAHSFLEFKLEAEPPKPWELSTSPAPKALNCVSIIEGLLQKKPLHLPHQFISMRVQRFAGRYFERHASSAGSKTRSQQSILVQVVGRNGKEIIKGGVQVLKEATLEDLKKAIQQSKYSFRRLNSKLKEHFCHFIAMSFCSSGMAISCENFRILIIPKNEL